MEETNDDIMKLKQDLLKTEIIEKNYDKEKFLDYCISKKENGDDLSSWSYDGLKKTVSEFIQIPQEIISQEKEIEKEEQAKKEIIVDIEKIKIYVNFLNIFKSNLI